MFVLFTFHLFIVFWLLLDNSFFIVLILVYCLMLTVYTVHSYMFTVFCLLFTLDTFLFVFTMAPTLVGPWSCGHPAGRSLTDWLIFHWTDKNKHVRAQPKAGHRCRRWMSFSASVVEQERYLNTTGWAMGLCRVGPW